MLSFLPPDERFLVFYYFYGVWIILLLIILGAVASILYARSKLQGMPTTAVSGVGAVASILYARSKQRSATLSVILGTVGVVFVLPSLLLTIAGLVLLNSIAPSQLVVDLVDMLGARASLLAYLGIGGLIIALLGIGLQLAGVGGGTEVAISSAISSSFSLGPEMGVNPSAMSGLGGVQISPNPPSVPMTGNPTQLDPSNMGNLPKSFSMTANTFPNGNFTQANLSAIQSHGAPIKTMILRPSQPVTPSAWLMVIEGRAAGREFGLTGDNISLGRALNNEIVLDDDSISSNHARIKLENKVYYLYDLASTNGTFKKDLDGSWRRVYREPIVDRDNIKLGGLLMSFYCPSQTTQTALESTTP